MGSPTTTPGARPGVRPVLGPRRGWPQPEPTESGGPPGGVPAGPGMHPYDGPCTGQAADHGLHRMATILVVDDEPDIRYLVKVNLELDGHTVLTAANGAEALELVKIAVPDLLLLDLMMPEVDGWTVLEQIKAHSQTDISTIPVLMLSAFTSEENQLRGAIEGAIRYLGKPIAPEELRKEVRDALGGDPEPVKRRRARTEALARLARRERGTPVTERPAPRLTRLERARPRPRHDDGGRTVDPAAVAGLTDKQRELLEAIAAAPSVSRAAEELGVSRSNVYASLRRITRKLGAESVSELVELTRAGRIPGIGGRTTP